MLASSLVLVLLFWQWRPLPQVVWQVDGEPWRIALYALSALGWLLLLSSTFLISHSDLFGLRQAWSHSRGLRTDPDVPFVTRAVKFLEERDLVAQFGDTYRDYQRRVPMLLPLPGRRKPV